MSFAQAQMDAELRGEARGKREGKREGKTEGLDLMGKLFGFLIADQRQEDMSAATQNPVRREQLLREYRLV